MLKTQSSRGRRSSSEKSRYRYLRKPELSNVVSTYCLPVGKRLRTYLSVSERKKLCCMLSWLSVVV